MIVTIFEIKDKKELHYWIQEYSGVKWLVYDVSQESIELIKNCETSEVQNVIETIMKTSRLVSKTL